MFSLFEVQGQSSLLHKSGTVEINTEYRTEKKPVWLVLLKLLGVAAMVAVGAAIQGGVHWQATTPGAHRFARSRSGPARPA